MLHTILNLNNISILISTIILVCIFLQWQNNGIKVTPYEFEDLTLPDGFNMYKIIHISDYHNAYALHKSIINHTKSLNGNIIVITGDLVDCRKTDINAGLALVKDLIKIAPVYYVSGNHEARLKDYNFLKQKLLELGVTVLDDKKFILHHNNSYLTLIGVSDPRFYTKDNMDDNDKKAFRNHLLSINESDFSYKILLSHRPEFIHTYRDSNINLALTGHAHGGQFGIPFTDKGLFVPNQGILPKYAAGMVKEGNTTEIISRGLGNSLFPFRLFNRPEIVTVTFYKK